MRNIPHVQYFYQLLMDLIGVQFQIRLQDGDSKKLAAQNPVIIEHSWSLANFTDFWVPFSQVKIITRESLLVGTLVL